MTVSTTVRRRRRKERCLLFGWIALQFLQCRSLSQPSSRSLPVGHVYVDYSAAAEYIAAHYDSTQDDYFGTPTVRLEDVFDARDSLVQTTNNKNNGTSKSSFEEHSMTPFGFTLVPAPTRVTDFADLSQIRHVYATELKATVLPRALHALLGAKESSTIGEGVIRDVVLWHPMLRGEDWKMEARTKQSPSKANVASKVHMDTDVGAYGIEGLLKLILSNAIEDVSSQRAEQLQDDLMTFNRRFCLLNIWRPMHSVVSAPLGILHPQYHQDTSKSFPQNPNSRLDMGNSRWYIVSRMQPDECLVFYQFDRRVDQPFTDLWHCALDLPSSDSSSSTHPRQSFDIKALVVLDERVPRELDRLLSYYSTAKPKLTLEESGVFCNAQERKFAKAQRHHG